MPNLDKCIRNAIDAGQITEQVGIDLQHRVDGFRHVYTINGKMSPEAATRAAQREALASKRAEVALQRRQKALQAIALHKAVQDARTHPDGFAAGVMSLMVKDVGRRVKYSNIDNRAKTILAQFHAEFADAMNKYRTKALGLVQDKEGLRNMVRELFGTNTGDANAKMYADVWGRTAEMARQRFNRAGGAIPKREDWGMPQYHDPIRVGKVSKEEWIKDIEPRLDRTKMVTPEGIPMSEMEFRMFLDHAYDTIRSNGLVDMMPGRIGGSKLANRRRDHRVMVFKDADAWLEYHDKYGHADVYTTMTDHLTGMAQDIAKLEIMGPNPESTYRYLRDMAMKDGTQGLKLGFLDSVWDTTTGKANIAESVHMADFMQAVRHWLVSARLGGAFLSSISDLGFTRETARFNGLSATKVFNTYLSLMNPRNADDRLMAVKMQLTADAWVTRALAANRHTEVTGAGFSAKAADFTMRASFLSAHTDSMRKAFGMEFQAAIATQIGKKLDDVQPELKRAMEAYGITAKDWEIIRKTETLKHPDNAKVEYFSPENMMKRTDLSEGQRLELNRKIQEMILTETDFAVPTPDARVRAITTAGAKRGSFMGEFSRSIFLFKSFPVTIISTHLYRGALQNGLANKGKYLASIAISTTVLGGIAIQMKEVSRGKDPRDMKDPKFWGAAFVQGGGAGIYGDFLFSDANRFGNGLIDASLGPVVGFGNDVAALTLGNAQEFFQGKDTNLGADLVRFARSYTPGGSLWYTRLAFEREVLDQLQLMADKKAKSKFRRLESKRRKDYGQKFWWRPGEKTPRRGPSIEAATGGR